MQHDIPFIDLGAQQRRLKSGIDAAIQGVLAHGKYIMGPEVGRLEGALAAYANVSEVVCCSNGTDALFMGLMALDVRPGDAVFVPSFTFAATVEVVSLIGATPVFVDVEEDSYTLSLASLEAAYDLLQRQHPGLRPRGVISVDLFGRPAHYDELQAFVRKHQLFLMVDAAQSFGARFQGRATVTYGDLATTSFFPAKPLGGYGDGGAVFTENKQLSDAVRSIRVHGMGQDQYDNVRLGITGRLDTLQAAILLEKLKIFSEEVLARAEVAQRYTKALARHVTCPLPSDARYHCVWAQYTIQVDNRDQVRAALQEKGIPTMVYYPKPLHKQAAYQDSIVGKAGLPATERLAQRVLSLPMHPYLTREVQDFIVDQVLQVV